MTHLAARSRPRGYHHGDLRRGLLQTGVELARAGGPDAVTLREASRRLGVSHNAAYRHYADRDALVDAVAAYGFEALARTIRTESAKVGLADPKDAAVARLRAIGTAYVAFAVREPGLYRTMFACKSRPPDPADPSGGVEASLDAFSCLMNALDDLVAVGVLAPEQRPRSEFAAWATVHGLADMFIDGPLCGLPKRERQPIVDRTLDVVATGLVQQPAG